jgi:hypothetical protein
MTAFRLAFQFVEDDGPIIDKKPFDSDKKPFDSDKKPFDWNCCKCVDALMETLDKAILAAAAPIICPIPATTIESRPDSSSAGSLNPISDDNTESTASGHSNKDMGQPLNDGSYGTRAEFSWIEPKQNLSRLDHFDDTDLVKNSGLTEFDTPLHTTAPESDWKGWSNPACTICDDVVLMGDSLPPELTSTLNEPANKCEPACSTENGTDKTEGGTRQEYRAESNKGQKRLRNEGETTSMKAVAITLGTAWIGRLILTMQVPVNDCRFQSNSVHTPDITTNGTSTVMCF